MRNERYSPLPLRRVGCREPVEVMMDAHSTEEKIKRRLALEVGRIEAQGKRRIGLVYPSAYAVGMSSLGFQTVYRALNHIEDTVCERAFLPDAEDNRDVLLTYESRRPLADCAVVAFSVAYELELFGLFTCLERMGVKPLARVRDARSPLVVVGGPLTIVNAKPLAPFADVVVIGEAEPVLAPLVNALFDGGERALILERLAVLPGVWVPTVSSSLPDRLCADDMALPAVAAIWTPEASLASMFLVEAERGCSRGCSFCVMRRGKDAGMRLVAKERVLAAIPRRAPRVGIVGAAVSDHPELVDIVGAVVERGQQVGLSSLRADRITGELVRLLVRGGNRTLTIAADGASERLRRMLDKRITAEHLLNAAELAREHSVPMLKLYVMVGVPDEQEEDLDELVALGRALRQRLGAAQKLVISLSVFVPKPGTPLQEAEFVGVAEAERRIARLRRLLKGQITLVGASGRWAWVEHLVAQGSQRTGLQMYDAWRGGATFAAIKRAVRQHERSG